MLQTASYQSFTPFYYNSAAQHHEYYLPKQQQQQQCEPPSCCTSSSRSIDEIVLDLLRGKVAQCHEQLLQGPRVETRATTIAPRDWLGHCARKTHASCDGENNNASHTLCCVCKFLVIVDCAGAPQYWLVQMKRKEEQIKTPEQMESTHNYLNCIDTLELYNSLDDVCNVENCLYRFSNKNWFFFEHLVRLNVLCGVDVLLEDFTLCNKC